MTWLWFLAVVPLVFGSVLARGGDTRLGPLLMICSWPFVVVGFTQAL
jgi:hypothetical protein